MPPPHQPGYEGPFERDKVLFVEGTDPWHFFTEVLGRLRIGDAIELRNFGGVAQLRGYLKAASRMEGFSRLTSIAIVIDAEEDAAARFQSVCAGLAQAGLPAPARILDAAAGPPAVRVLVLPDGARPGKIESLCLAALAGSPALACVDALVACARQAGMLPIGEGRRALDETKARLHAYLSLHAIPEHRLGLALRQGHIPLDHAAFDPLKQFLRAI